MVAHRPPDEALLAVGAAFRTGPLLEAARRLLPVVRRDLAALTIFGIARFAADDLEALIDEITRLHGDKRAKNKDTPLQMRELAELMARIRAWLRTLRLMASLNLAGDGPALMRISSVAPELAEGYPRDLLSELDRVLSAARDLRPRVEDAGLSEAFLGLGSKLAQQLRTSIGKKDLEGQDLSITVRRLYMRKAELFMLEKRLVRAGQLAFLAVPGRQSAYHLEEIEPAVVEPAGRGGSSAQTEDRSPVP